MSWLDGATNGCCRDGKEEGMEGGKEDGMEGGKEDGMNDTTLAGANVGDDRLRIQPWANPDGRNGFRVAEA